MDIRQIDSYMRQIAQTGGSKMSTTNYTNYTTSTTTATPMPSSTLTVKPSPCGQSSYRVWDRWDPNVVRGTITMGEAYNALLKEYSQFFSTDMNTERNGTLKMFMDKNDVTYTLTKTKATVGYNSSIQSIKVYVPDKVMGVWIAGKEYKQVVKEPDIFSMEFGCALALAKHMYGSMLTPRGIELAAENLLYLKPVVKEIKTAIRMYKDMEKAKAKEAAREEEIKAIKARRREKNRLRREKRKQKR